MMHYENLNIYVIKVGQCHEEKWRNFENKIKKSEGVSQVYAMKYSCKECLDNFKKINPDVIIFYFGYQPKNKSEDKIEIFKNIYHYFPEKTYLASFQENNTEEEVDLIKSGIDDCFDSDFLNEKKLSKIIQMNHLIKNKNKANDYVNKTLNGVSSIICGAKQ